MTSELRRATAEDIPHLARFATEAYGGFNEVLYDGQAPGQSLESLLHPQFAAPDSTPFYENHWVAMADGQVAGGMHGFPWEALATFPRDPLVPEARHEMVEGMMPDLPAPGTYYIHVLTVYPEFHRKGIASSLLALALKQTAEKGLTGCSLYVFAENTSAIALYEKYGFEVTDRGPVTDHPLFYYTGDMLLMTCAV